MIFFAYFLLIIYLVFACLHSYVGRVNCEQCKDFPGLLCHPIADVGGKAKSTITLPIFGDMT